MLKELVKLANHLDRLNYRKEADYVDNILKNAKLKELSFYVFSDKYTLSEDEKEELKSKFVMVNLTPSITETTTEKYKSITNREDKIKFLSDKILVYKKDDEFVLNYSIKNMFLKSYGSTIEEAVADFFNKQLSSHYDTE